MPERSAGTGRLVSMEIVGLSPEDWATFRDVRLAALAEAPAAFGSRLEDEAQHDEARWRARLAARTQLVARGEGGAVLGTVGILAESPVIELISMWVAPAARGRGVGEALVTRVIAEARALGGREVRLDVAVDNPGAERLYARCGFARTGELARIRPGEPRLEARMVRLM
jgi:ribosomal protein S18 acetylase RimI-like enzyme